MHQTFFYSWKIQQIHFYKHISMKQNSPHTTCNYSFSAIFNECSMTNQCLKTTDLSQCNKDLPFASLHLENQSTIVGIATILWTGECEVQTLLEARDFSLLQNVQTRDPLPKVKQPGREVNHSPPSSAKVKNECSYTSTSWYAFMVWTGKTSPSPSHSEGEGEVHILDTSPQDIVSYK
jgi:hypothetical protein